MSDNTLSLKRPAPRMKREEAIAIIEALIEENHQLRIRLERLEKTPVQAAEDYLANLRESTDADA
jgi:hypothetical protein